MRSQVSVRVTVAMSLMLAVTLLVAGGMASTQVQAHQFTVRNAATPALAALPTSGSLFFASLRDGPQEIYRHDFASSTVKRITTGGVAESFPSASPDGTRVCFESYRTGNYEIFCADRDGNNPVNLTNDPGQDGMPRFSPDGTLIAYHRWAVGTSGFQIWVMNADGSNKRQLTFETGYMGEPFWFPSGTKLVFDGDKPDRNLLTINLDGSGLTVINNQPGEQRSPSVTPDGSYIYYDSSESGGTFQVYRMAVNGTGQTALTSGSQNMLPQVSPDGTFVAFMSNRDGGDTELYVSSSDGTNQTRLTNNVGVDSVPVWANAPATSTCTPELVTVPFVNGPNGVTSQQAYTGVVTLTVTGTGQAAGGQYSDAFYLYAAANGAAITPQHYTALYNWVFWINNQHAENLIPGAQVPAYRADHAYTFPVNAPGGTLSFGVGDTATGDNAGSYSVAICRTTASTYAVSGRVTDSSSTPLAGVVVADGTRSATTGSDGRYTLSAVPAGNYTLTPSKSGYSFTPTSRTVTVTTGNLIGQDFSAIAQLQTYSVTGQVRTSSGVGIAGVVVTAGGKSATTGSDGRYTLVGLTGGSYTLLPTKSGYSFNPIARNITVAANLSGQDFTTAQTASVSGRITESSGTGLAGVTVAVSGFATTTGSDGSYTLSGLAAGSYTLTPSKSGYSFTPTSRTATVTTSNLSGQDFVGTKATQNLVNVSISLYGNPLGTQRAAYEEIVRYFADGVFEESNGAHKLGTVTIYPNQGLTGRANIQWIVSCWPNAHISGYGTPGLRIAMCDSFSGVNFLSDREAGGYVLAHEWGHYYYSLYDEYRGGSACQANAPGTPCLTDTPVLNSIMHSQWEARGGHYNWLNFSTALNNTRNTAQHRVYGASGWETLARSPALDPRGGVLRNYPVRLYYPELAAVAPLAGQAARIDLVANHTARSAVQIVWASSSSSASLTANPSGLSANAVTLNGGQITYPEPIRVLAVLQREQPIVGAEAEGVMVAPDGSSQSFTLRDDGVAPDQRASDGLYAALLTTKQNGAHTLQIRFSNTAGQAQEITDSGALAPPLPGITPQMTAPPPITDPFEVLTELTVQVTGVQADDYGDTPATATALVLNSTDVAGQIDRAGDDDLFRITTVNAMPLAVRVTDLGLGMQPQLRLLAADGTTELARADLSTSAAADYLLLTQTVPAGTTVYIELTHRDPTAVQGVYRISAGTLLGSESAGPSVNKLYLPLTIR